MPGADLLRRLAERPELAAVLLDVDGTLAPIVERPEDARVPDTVRDELTRLAGRYALVACISGRTSDDAARVVGVEGIRYVGEHGLELSAEPERWAERLHSFAETIEWPLTEAKRLSVSYHYRTAPDEEAAKAELADVAARAAVAGLRARWGRKVLEIRPPVAVDKGTAVETLLDEAGGLERALYAGDDRTDLDAFRAVAELELGVRVAVASAEATEVLIATADLVVAGPAGLAERLEEL